MNDKRKNKRTLNIYGIMLMVITCCIFGLNILGLSYAYWQYTVVSDKTNTATSGCFKVEMVDQKDEINLTNAYPITNAEGLKLTPFSFTLKNTCTIDAYYYVNVEVLAGTTLNSKWVATKINDNAIATLDTFSTTATAIDGSLESYRVAEGSLAAGATISHKVSFWMDEAATVEDDVMNKIFKSKIVVVSEPINNSTKTSSSDTEDLSND